MDEVSANVLFFAKSKEITGTSEEKVALPSRLTGDELKKLILNRFPLLEPIGESFILAVNQNYVFSGDEQLVLRDGEEIAVIPPISGG